MGELGVAYRLTPSSVLTKGSTSSGKNAIRESVQVELFLDFCCPFSKKMFLTVKELFKILEVQRSDSSSTEAFFVVHQLPQPWHPQSAFMHEAGLAVRKLGSSEIYFKFCELLFQKQTDFFDDATWEKNRLEIYDDLAKIAEEAGIRKDDFLTCLRPDPTLRVGEVKNYGNAVTD